MAGGQMSPRTGEALAILGSAAEDSVADARFGSACRVQSKDLATLARRAPLAQLAEQLTLNQRVGGSIPSRRTL
jgi:hypothetical protein